MCAPTERRSSLLALVLGAVLVWSAPMAPATPAADAAGAAQASADPTREGLDTIESLIATRSSKRAEIKRLRRELKHPGEDSDLKLLETTITEAQAEIETINTQIAALATGVGAGEFDLDAGREIDLKAEAEQLLQPFVIMLQAATEQARQIESLRRTRTMALNHRLLAERALEKLAPLVAGAEDAMVVRELSGLQEIWQDRLASVDDLIAATERQLAAKLDQRSTPAESANEFARSFIRDRGFNLLKGLAVLFAVLATLRFVGRRVIALRATRGMRKNLLTRVVNLVYTLGSIVVALVATLVTFNLLNDWLLLGLTVIFLVALVWVGIRMLPGLIEQLTLYLNLGAVQEGERVFFDGIPWLVRRLDFYCDLYNPVLEGGEFTMPIRELIGLHSRPMAQTEAWFPTLQGDFVRLEQGVARVLTQTPGVVEVELEGGIRMQYPAAAFFVMAPQNLSRGARAEVVFGIGYRHQADATGAIRTQLREFVRAGLGEVLEPQQIRAVDVEILQAGPSSIDYQVECDLSGDAAVHFETVERLLARLCIDACNHYGWEIPYPQLVLHERA